MKFKSAHCSAGVLLLLGAAAARSQQPSFQALSSHRYADALQLAQSEIERQPSAPAPWLAKALAQNGLGRTEESYNSLDQALKLDGKYLRAAEAGAQIAYSAHDPRASHYLALVLAGEPLNPTAHAMSGVLAFEQSDCASALEHFDKAGSMIETNPHAELQYAVCLGRTGKTSAAATRFEQLHTLSPEDRAITYDLAAVEVDQGKFREAVQLLEQSRSRVRPLDGDTMDLLAKAYAGNGQIAEALDTFRAAIALNPHDERQYSDLAMLSMDHQSPEVALGVLDAGIRNNPKSASLHTMRGSIYAQIAKNERAQEDFETADRLSPTQMSGTIGMGVLLRDDGNLDRAQTLLETKLKSNSDDPVLNYMLADILIRKGAAPGQPEFTRAERLLTSATARKPDFAQAHAELGKLQMKAGRLPTAIEHLELATKLDPMDRTALNQLVAAYRRSGRTDEAAHVATRLAQAVDTERSQETEKNRIHLVLDTPPGKAQVSP